MGILTRFLPKPTRKGMTAHFRDDKGRWWYTFTDPADMPIARYAEIQTTMQFMAAGLTPELFTKAMDAITEHLAKAEIVKAGAVIADLTELHKKVVNLDAIVNVIALSYVRQDEQAETVSSVIHQQKCDYLKHETDEGRFFFRLPMCLQLLNSPTLSNEQSVRLWADYASQTSRLLARWRHGLSEPSKSESTQTA
jgi:predicted DNA-binding ribbon-helix-helix protein